MPSSKKITVKIKYDDFWFFSLNSFVNYASECNDLGILLLSSNLIGKSWTSFNILTCLCQRITNIWKTLLFNRKGSLVLSVLLFLLKSIIHNTCWITGERSRSLISATYWLISRPWGSVLPKESHPSLSFSWKQRQDPQKKLQTEREWMLN